MGFSLIEVLVVIAIIGILARILLTAFAFARDAAAISAAGTIQKNMITAVELYYDDMGFYPPDVNRGWDPGFVQPLPWNADEAAGDPPQGDFATSGTNCDHCPLNWEDIVSLNWNGPYMTNWPRFTPWNGKYDYNYWGTATNRYGCPIPAGVYIGVQPDYDENHPLTEKLEQKMIDKELEYEECINGESQMSLLVF
ncbi:MAG: hypothetical protein A3B96_02555 [Candidatus Spechtbacteria bacterium RIFCSPHIGHO2_02_FULL_43_15b]|uniref:Type II secretion system protein GspG C-terminal domain-containing protein n=1 Tax=Candidatus Spechtbacteria bacterium RIFCSPHIGHO2_01_FULL_43_30 TaxID=1802158 RepID=A0A1G2H6M0_9BACT|nr:MAG: hypothetical protein A2827_02710 [Candidatus Spechtbacteria bacterium RIFCSPHIGHO2_01_FULL_43_30]OGZ60182.1 MAG: hypothetical protein A3B96_02555 [Candidatus Spechtbacteria bacterium RIFCSPHIGHO2_02_FULL_43_15b]